MFSILRILQALLILLVKEYPCKLLFNWPPINPGFLLNMVKDLPLVVQRRSWQKVTVNSINWNEDNLTRIFCMLPITLAEYEWLFRTLCWLKTYSRAPMSRERVSGLSLFFPLPSSHPLRSPRPALKAPFMQAALINICCSGQIDISAAIINSFCTEAPPSCLYASWVSGFITRPQSLIKYVIRSSWCNVFSNNYWLMSFWPFLQEVYF